MIPATWGMKVELLFLSSRKKKLKQILWGEITFKEGCLEEVTFELSFEW